MASALQDAAIAARATYAGAVLLPGEPEYEESNNRFFNIANREKRPAVIFVPSGTSAVAAAVKFAVAHGVHVTAKCGGHGVGGRATVKDGVVVDLQRLRHVVVDPVNKLVHFGGGALLEDLDRETAVYKVAVPLGTFGGTGAGGLALHGGAGLLSGRYGLTVDNIVELEVVTGTGEVVVANATQHAELFTCMRGAACFMGIATRITTRAFDVPARVYGGLAVQPLIAGLGPHYAWLHEVSKEDLDTNVFLFTASSPHGQIVMTMGAYTGHNLEEGRARLDSKASCGPIVNAGFQESSFHEVNDSFTKAFSSTKPPPTRQYWRNFVFRYDDLCNADFVKKLDAAREMFFKAMPFSLMITEVWNRATAKQLGGETLNNMRGDLAAVCFVGSWLEAAEDQKSLEVLDEIATMLKPFVLDRNYINYNAGTAADTEQKMTGRAINEASRARIIAAKKIYDPNNSFWTP